MKVSTVDDRWRKQFIVDLNDRWKLDDGQAAVARAIFRDNKKLAVWQAGRKRGKSTVELWTLCRAAGTRAGGIFFWFAPRAKQAREIVWASNRLQTFLPKKYIKQVKSTEMRLILFNDSFIKLDGSDEYEQYRGVECDGAVYDEAKDFDYRFDTAFRPNLGPRKAFLFAAGTPPRNMVSASELGYFALVAEAKFREDGYFALAPSWDRPDPDWQDEIKKIKALYAYRASQGDEDAWNEFKCEYGGEYVEGGPGSIIPMFRMDKHVHPHERIQAELRYQSHDLEFFAIADPGNNHPFAVLFMAFDKSKPRVYFLDELYETDQAENTTGRMHPRIMEKVREFYPWPEMWRYVYDEAALWFKAHMMNSGEDPGWCQTNKAAMRSRRPNEVKPYLDVFKDALLGDDVVWISDRCQNLIREIKGYKKMEDGSIPKKGDDLLDTTRYGLAEAGFSFSPSAPVHTSVPNKLRSNEYSGYVEDEREDLEKLLTPSDGIIWDFSRW